MSVLTDPWKRAQGGEKFLMDPDSLSSECAAGPRFTLHLELPLFLWFRYCTMVEMQLLGLAYKKNILALFTEFGRSTWKAARAGDCVLALPC